MTPTLDDRWIYAGFAAALLVVAGLGTRAWYSTVEFRETADAVARWHGALAHAEAIKDGVHDAQRGVRGLLLTREPRFRADMADALGRSRVALQRLQTQLGDDRERVASLERLGLLVDRFADAQERLADLPDRHGASDRLVQLAATYGQPELDAVLAGVAECTARLQARVGLLRRREVAVANDTTAIVAVGGVTAFLLVLASVVALRAEQRRREGYAEVIRDLYDNAPCGYHSVDPEGRLVQINATELAWFGLPRDQVLGRRLTDFLTPASRPNFDRVFEALRLRGAIAEIEYQLVAADGSVRDVLLAATAVCDERGRFLRSRTTVLDITAHKRAEAERERLIGELREALARVRTLSGLLPICAWCKKIRDDQGYWQQIERYVSEHTEAHFTHGICPDCVGQLQEATERTVG